MTLPGTYGSTHCRARLIGCTPGELRGRNGEMTELIRRESTGHRWPVDRHRGVAGAGEDSGARIHDVHPDASETWLELRPLSA